jgi:putative transposase
MNDIRRMQENPELGAFRIHAALEQKRGGVEVSVRTVGRIMAVHRSIYGFEKPKRSPHQKKQMPFEAKRRHQIWTADVRYIKKHRLPVDCYVYVISILENYSRMILASAVCRRQDLNSFLPVLYSAIERYGSPETFVTDSGSIFLANRARKIYEALNIEKVEIEKGQPWQSYIETNFNTQRKMADYHFRKVENWEELVDAHERWMGDYNAQRHWLTSTGKTVAGARKRCWASTPVSVTIPKTSGAPSSRPASSASSTLWVTRGLCTGASWVTRGWPRGMSRCGFRATP